MMESCQNSHFSTKVRTVLVISHEISVYICFSPWSHEYVMFLPWLQCPQFIAATIRFLVHPLYKQIIVPCTILNVRMCRWVKKTNQQMFLQCLNCFNNDMLSGSSFSFVFSVNWISLAFGLMVGQSKTSEDINLAQLLSSILWITKWIEKIINRYNDSGNYH